MINVLFDLLGSEPAPNGVINHGGGEYCKTVFNYYYENYDNTKVDLHVMVSGHNQDIMAFLKNYQVTVDCLDSNAKREQYLEREQFNSLFCGLYCGQYENVKFPSKTKLILTEHGLRGIEINFDKFFVKTEKKKLKNNIKRYMSKIMPKRYLKIKKGKYEPEFKITDNFQLVTVSNHSKYAIEYYFPYLKGKIMVGYSPMKVVCNDCHHELEKLGIEPQKYVLMINANRGEKNCLRALYALDDLGQKGMLPQGYKVVLTGVTYQKPFKRFKNIDIVYLGYVSAQVLDELYAKAHLFLYPSINEGFGYPPLEAMKYGTFVAASAICSIPEVCGDAVLYFNPYDIVEIGNRIKQSFDEEIRQRYIMKIKDRLSYIEEKQEEGLKRLLEKINGEHDE